MKIEVGKFYRTRNGKKVRIYAVDGSDNNSHNDAIHGAVLHDDGWKFNIWHSNGNEYCGWFESGCDIVSEWKDVPIMRPGVTDKQ